MKINAHLPTQSLRPFIKIYLIIESPGDGINLVNRVVPDTSLALSFKYKGQINYVAEESNNDVEFSTFSGLRKAVRIFNYSKNAGNILVLFKEARATAFFKEPFHELYGDIITLDNFINHQNLSIIEEQLAEATNNIQRIALIERFLLSKLYDHKPDKLILAALQKIHSTNGQIKIKDLAATLYISQDPFEKRFRRAVGTSPKQFSSIIRMESIISGSQQNQKLAEMVFDAGYYDQQHFNKDFKRFTGLTPASFFKSPSPLQINDFLL